MRIGTSKVVIWSFVFLIMLGMILSVILVSSEENTLNTKGSWNVYPPHADIQFLSHTATKEDIEAVKARIGVREPNKNYNVIIDGHGTGLTPPTEEEWDKMIGNVRIVKGASNSSFSASIDHSQSLYFPPVGNQGGQGSCAAWAVTYYANGFQQALDKNWTDASTGNTEHLMSPAWTYNKANYGTDAGSHTWTNAKVIQSVGSATWSTMPYSAANHVSWGSENAWRSAPEYRCSNIYTVFAPFDNTTIDIIKNALNNNQLVTFALHADSYAGLGSGDDTITSAEIVSDYNHANTIVGYDDNKTVDGETGAFKIVNSWGSNWGSAWGGYGFYWMTYEAFTPGVYAIVWFDDMSNHQPSLLGVWNLDPEGSRDASITMGIGPHENPCETRIPLWDSGSHNFPSFMCLDITEFEDKWDAETNLFYLEIDSGDTHSTIASFKIEIYKVGYNIGSPTSVSNESFDTPKTTPCYVTVELDNMLPRDFIYINSNTDFTSENGVINGSGTKIDPYIIKNGDINASTTDGITIKNTDAYFIIKHCFIHAEKNNSYKGIYFYNVTNGIIDSIILYNNRNALVFNHSSNNTITNCIVTTNDRGISFLESSNNMIMSSDIYNNFVGVHLNFSLSSTIASNTIYNNSYGICLFSSSNNNISSSLIYNNTFSIEFDNSSENNIRVCQISNNHYGISIFYSSLSNKIIYCNFTDNEYGVYISYHADYPSNFNIFYHNNFVSNNQSAYDPHINWWDDNVSAGNYWDDYKGGDADGDGIGDAPYTIGSEANIDNYPFMNLIEYISPTVISTSPSNNEIDVSVNTSIIIMFSEPINKLSMIGNITISPWIGIEFYNWSNDHKTLTLILSSYLSSYTIYNVTIKTNIKDLSQNSLQNSYSFSFRTKDVTPPVANAGFDMVVDEDIESLLNATLSSDNAGIVSWTWSFTDQGIPVLLYGETVNYVFTQPGIYLIILNVSDAAGNWDATMTNITVRDTTPPTITITSPEDNFITNQNITLTYTVSDNVDDIGNITVNVENGTTYTDERNYTITINATDKAGNIGWRNISFVIDRTEPEITVTGIENNGYYNVTITPVIYVTDSNLDKTSVTLNNETFISGTVVTDNGNYILVVEATDKAGNTANKTISFTVDKPPRISITGVEDNTYYNVDVVPMIDVVDTNLNNTIITLNDNVFISGTPISEEGTYILTVWANDAGGNTASKTIMFVIDKTKPVITIINVTDNTYYNAAVIFMVKITEKNQYTASGKLNNIDFDPAATIMIIAEGKYPLVVQAVDEAGNIANKTITFTIDKTKPTLSDIIPENGTKTTKDRIMISGKTEPNAVVKINRVDVTVSADGRFSKEIMLVKGDNIITITATDKAGNTNTHTITINKIETTKPAIIPGFKVIMLIIGLGVSAVLLKRKR